MSRRYRPGFVREAVAVLDAHGHAADIDLGAGGHVKISWLTNGRKRMLVVGHTPSDRRADKNARAMLRRLLRADGGEGARS
jgi:hypothetical protein